jgi:nicotinic acid mononucleotide adenylyltransferase
MMKILKQTYSQNTFSLLIGEDAALEVEGSWKYGTTLINENRFLVLPRGFSKPEQWAWYLSGKHAYLETFPIMDELQYKSPISSTTVRASFGRALNTYVLGYMLEPGVLSYIVENNLYYATEGMQWVPRD